MFFEEVGKKHLARVQRQKFLEQLNRRLDELRDHAKAVHENEFFRLTFGQLVAIVLLIRLVNGVQVFPIQPGDYLVVQLREELMQCQWQLSSCLE